MKRFLLALAILLSLSSPVWAGDKTLVFSWNQEISADFGGWRLYMSTSPNVAVSPANLKATIPYGGTQATEYTSSQPITSPDSQEVRYYFVMTAFDTAQNESAKSNEVSELIDFMAPGIPIQLRVIVQPQ